MDAVLGWNLVLSLPVILRRPAPPATCGVFATVFTMSASVWVELLAKPGALARAQRGLVSVPRPLRALRRSSRRLSRYAQITGIAVSYRPAPTPSRPGWSPS
jgi:hypothetical protein